MITFIIPFWDDNEQLEKSLNCIFSAQQSSISNVHVIILQMLEYPELKSYIQNHSQTVPEKITILDTYNLPIYQAYSYALEHVDTKYVIFGRCGDTTNMTELSHALTYFDKHHKKFHLLSLQTSYESDTIPSDIHPETLRDSALNTIISLEKTPTCVPTSIYGYIFLTDAVKKTGFSSNLVYDAGIDMVYKLLCKKPYLGYAPNATYTSCYVPESDTSRFSDLMNKDWYFQTFEDFLFPTLKYYNNQLDELPLFIQYAAIYQIQWRYRYNANNGNKHIIDNELDEFFSLTGRILSMISNQVIFNYSLNPKFELNLPLKFALLYLKKNGHLDPEFIIDRKAVYMAVDHVTTLNLAKQKIFVDLLDVVDHNLIMEASTDSFIGLENLHLVALFNNAPVEIEETYRYAHTKYFGISTHKRYTFRISIPMDKLTRTTNSIQFCLKYQNTFLPLKFSATTYNAKVSTNVSGSYWLPVPTHMAYYTQGNTILSIDKVSVFKKLKQELHLMKGMFFGKYRSRSMFCFRILYWITHPFLKHKTIWLTYDKLYKGGDCGEYLYRYMCTRKDAVTPAYVVNGDSPDYKRLKKEGYHPLRYGSLKHRLYYVNSSVVFTTHGGVHSFNAFTNKQVSFVQDLLHHDVACIQHGLTVQQLAFNSNRLFNNMKRYYCASKYEIANLSHPIYGYEDKSVLKLTGIPRYDGLANNDQKQILITPTWRNYIAMPAASKNNAKPYSPTFIHTDYFKIYNALLSDSRLVSVAKETGYKIIYLLHPVISAQIDDYPKHEGIEIVPALDINYEKILTESSLMVTDYSGVQFDFAYMRKPVVYYHPPKLPPHYKEGGFFYDTMGFGEICTEHDSLVNTLCDYMLNNCHLKPFYRDRQDDFFAYSDLNSCKRIYDDMMEYQTSKK